MKSSTWKFIGIVALIWAFLTYCKESMATYDLRYSVGNIDPSNQNLYKMHKYSTKKYGYVRLYYTTTLRKDFIDAIKDRRHAFEFRSCDIFSCIWYDNLYEDGSLSVRYYENVLFRPFWGTDGGLTKIFGPSDDVDAPIIVTKDDLRNPVDVIR